VPSIDLQKRGHQSYRFFVPAFLPPPAVPDRHRADDATREYPHVRQHQQQYDHMAPGPKMVWLA
ncbi:hypothetical protein, partial [Salmonella enterica]|uniref:hypothetical protein n=1 Tax=Salmonella enterica TaxID=28901 RepID=UPI0032982FC1